MANLVILESPFKINTVKNYLGSGYKVISCKGHFRDLPKSTLGVDIENGFEPHYISIRGKGDLIKQLRKEAKAANKVFLATDPDREGEAIAWHLSVALGIPVEKTLRVTFNELTKPVIKAGIKSPRHVDMNLVDAQQARRILDRIVGYKLSPLLWKNVHSGLSAGRVQSVVTRILVEREDEINAFVPEEYWTVTADLAAADGRTVTVRYYGEEKDGKRAVVSAETDAMKITKDAETKPFIVKSVKTSNRTRMPAPPFTTSTMQQEASRRLNFQSQRTMRVAQGLYEGVNLGAELGGVQGLITYMRTDSQRVSAEAQEAARALITEKYGADFVPDTPRQYKSRAGAQDAHEAIRPSRVDLTPAAVRKALTPDQYKLYKLIWERFVSSQMQSATLSAVTVEMTAGTHLFRAGGYTVTFPGFMALYEETEETVRGTGANRGEEDDEEKDLRLPVLREKEEFNAADVTPQCHYTEAPPRYNEATLVKLLEEKGIGRPSTYATIITTILARNYVVREGKSLVPTELGRVTTSMIMEYFPTIVDCAFTADMENELDDIEKGSDTLLHVLENFWGPFAKQLEQAAGELSEKTVEIAAEVTDVPCDKCGQMMVVKNGRFGKFLACPNYPQCRNTKPYALRTGEEQPEKEPETVEADGKTVAVGSIVPDMKCEKCGADMVVRSGKFGAFYACSRYPACKFTKQKAKEVGVDCPKCGAPIVPRFGKRHMMFYGCSSYPKCDFSSWNLPTNEKCPTCGEMLYVKKDKNLLVCTKEGCGYSRPAPEKTERAEETELAGTVGNGENP